MDNLQTYKRSIDLIKDNNYIVRDSEPLQQYIADCFYRVSEHLGDLFTADKMRDGHTKKLIFDLARVVFIKCSSEEDVLLLIDRLDQYAKGE